MENKILVIADKGCKETLALDKATQIATLYNASVHVVAFTDPSDEEACQIDFEKNFKQQVDEAFASDTTVSSQIVTTENIAKWAKQQIKEYSYDLVIKTGNRSESLFYTPTDWQLIRELDCSLLITSSQKWRSKSTILATVDISESNKEQDKMNQQVLTQADSWAKLLNEDLHMVYSVRMPKASIEFDVVEVDEVKRDKGPKAEQELTQLAEQSGLANAIQHIEFGDADKRIPSIANKIKADLVVMGSVGRKGINGFLLGNTAEKVMRNLRTDILIIKPE